MLFCLCSRSPLGGRINPINTTTSPSWCIRTYSYIWGLVRDLIKVGCHWSVQATLHIDWRTTWIGLGCVANMPGQGHGLQVRMRSLPWMVTTLSHYRHISGGNIGPYFFFQGKLGTFTYQYCHTSTLVWSGVVTLLWIFFLDFYKGICVTCERTDDCSFALVFLFTELCNNVLWCWGLTTAVLIYKGFHCDTCPYHAHNWV